MDTLSSLLARLRKSDPKRWAQAMAAPGLEPAARLILEQLPDMGPMAANVAALYRTWWASPRRSVWRLSPETVARVRDTGISYLPPIPPASWSGAALMIESADGSPLVGADFSLGLYQIEDQQGVPRYFVVAFDVHGSGFSESIRSDLGAVNDRLAREGLLLEGAVLTADDPAEIFAGVRAPSLSEQERVLEAVRFAFAFSFYAANPGDWSTMQISAGPPLRQGRKNRVVKRDGRPVPPWTYRGLEFPAPAREAGEARPLETEGLVLSPTVVRAHWRRLPGEDERVILIPAHASRRWKRDDRPEKKSGCDLPNPTSLHEAGLSLSLSTLWSYTWFHSSSVRQLATTLSPTTDIRHIRPLYSRSVVSPRPTVRPWPVSMLGFLISGSRMKNRLARRIW